MENSARMCPDKENIKMLLRHSIRFDKARGEEKILELRPEGKIMAWRLGESLDMTIGSISTSPSPRCINTCEEIINGYDQNHKGSQLKINKTEILKDTQVRNKEEADKTFHKLHAKGILKGFILNDIMPGVYDLNTSVKRMLDYIFSNGNSKNTVDIFCTHDLQIAMLLLYFFGTNEEYYNRLCNEREWPMMLEGMFLWGNKNNFNIAWRGTVKEIVFQESNSDA